MVLSPDTSPSIEGLRLLNGHAVDQEFLFECNNVVVFVLLDGSTRETEEDLDDLCRIMDEFYDFGVVTLVNFEHYNPKILHTASGVHTFKRLLLAYDPSTLVAQRYRSIFNENDRSRPTTFIIDYNGRVRWHGCFKDDSFTSNLKNIIPHDKFEFRSGTEGSPYTKTPRAGAEL